MCGITALYAWHADAPPVDREEVESITRYMIPRGPDAGGTWFSTGDRVGLGSRRLAIIDLTPEGNQPMTSGPLTIVFNGEIYNHAELRASLERRGVRFHSTSDTGVILELFRADGASMVERLRGMFALAIWDAESRRMFIARDPYGIKPLYFADDGRTFRAASTVKALLAGGAVSRTIDPAGAAGFFATGSVPEPFTIREAIRSVEAGTSFFVGAHGREAARSHYSIASVFAKATEQEWAANLVEPETLLRELTAESLRHHLVSDVPVGAFLSSGIDSTALVATASRINGEPLRTITLAFDAYRGLAEDEAPLAERFAAELGTRHTTRRITRTELQGELPKIFAAMDQPTIDGVNTYFVSKAAAEAGLKVAISGLGGDELFGGYTSFRDVPRMVALSRVPLAGALASRVTRHPKARAISALGRTWGGAYLVKRGLFLPDELPLPADVAEEGLRRLELMSIVNAPLATDPRTPFGRVATLEAALYMRNQLLRDTDWASMAHSLEVRTPLVDAWLLRQLAPLLVARGTDCKKLFASSPRPPLPAWLRDRPKTGFSFPLKQWLDLPPDGTSTRMRSWARMVYAEFAR